MKQITNYLLMFIFLFEVRFFYLFKLPEFVEKHNSYEDKIFILILSIIGVSFLFLTSKITSIIKGYKFNKYIVALIIIYVIQFAFSYIYYNDKITTLFAYSYYFLIIILYYLLRNLFYDKSKYYKFINFIVFIGLVTSIVFVIQGIVYRVNNNVFIHLYEVSSLNQSISLRNSNIRLVYPGSIISLSIIIAGSNIIMREKLCSYSISLLNVIFGFTYLICICQTRMLTISVVFAIMSMLLLKSSKNIYKKIVCNIILLIIVILILQLPSIRNFFESFNATEFSGSVYARTEGIQYYLLKIWDRPFNGLGFMDISANGKYFDIIHGPQGYLYTSDVGFIGLAVTLGGMGLVWYILLVYRLIRMSMKKNKNGNITKSIISIGMVSFILITSPTLIIANPERIILLPVIMAIIEFNEERLQ